MGKSLSSDKRVRRRSKRSVETCSSGRAGAHLPALLYQSQRHWLLKDHQIDRREIFRRRKRLLPRNPLSGCIRVGKHEIAHDTVQFIAPGNELAESPASGAERIEFFDRQSIVDIGAPEIDELPGELLHNSWLDRLVDARTDLDIAGIVAKLPCVRRRNDDITANKLAPVHVIAKRRREQSDSIAPLSKDLIRLLEYRHPSPLQISRIYGDVLLLGGELQRVIEPPDHDRTHRSHGRDIFAFALAPFKAALNRLGYGKSLWQGEANSRVDADPAISSLLDRWNTGASHGDFHDDIGRESVEFLCLRQNRLGVAIQPRVSLHREPAVFAAVRIEDRLQKASAFDRDFAD